MIKLDNEWGITCATCGQPGIQREVVVIADGSSGKYSYSTHSSSISSQEHFAALNRLDSFATRTAAVLQDLRSRDLSIKTGTIVAISYCPVDPSACEVRTEFRPMIDVKAFGRTQELLMPPVVLEGINVNKLFASIKKAAEALALEIKEKFESGQL